MPKPKAQAQAQPPARGTIISNGITPSRWSNHPQIKRSPISTRFSTPNIPIPANPPISLFFSTFARETSPTETPPPDSSHPTLKVAAQAKKSPNLTCHWLLITASLPFFFLSSLSPRLSSVYNGTTPRCRFSYYTTYASAR
jgi:hypothetical protein